MGLKRLYEREIEYIRAGINHTNKLDFLIINISVYKESIAINTFRSRFVATGLVPYDPERVLSKLNT